MRLQAPSGRPDIQEMTRDHAPTGPEGGSVAADASLHDPAETELLKERVRVVEELRVSEERFRTLLSDIPGAIPVRPRFQLGNGGRGRRDRVPARRAERGR